LAKEKPPIFGIIQRGGQVVMRMLANVKQVTIGPLYFTRDSLRRTTDVLVRRSPKFSSRTDKDVRPTKCLISPREKYN
jgi:hypothetical protein